jgi:hypothetical protein
MSLVAPFNKSYWSSPFGEWPQWRKNMGLGPHRGLDFSGMKSWTSIPTSGAGRVVMNGWSDGLGWYVVVYYPAGRVYFGYCHLAQRGPAVGTQFTRAGVHLAYVGNTGSATTGPHLHMTASPVNGHPGTVAVVNPAPYLTSTPSTSGSGYTPIPVAEEGDDLVKNYPIRTDYRTPTGTSKYIELDPAKLTSMKLEGGYDMDVTSISDEGYVHAKAHVVASGNPGDSFAVYFALYNPKTDDMSPHFKDVVVLDRNGEAVATRAFELTKPGGYRVYLRVQADGRNTGPVRLGRLSSTSSLYEIK